MNPSRFRSITEKYPALRVAVVGDVCLDRYLEIDPEKQETSIETGLAVHNVVNVRSQPGGAGTILNNLVALGVGDEVDLCPCAASACCGVMARPWAQEAAKARAPKWTRAVESERS